MHPIKNTADLKETIYALETKQAAQWQMVKQELLTTQNNLNPIHLIKSTISSAMGSPGIENSLLGTAMGMAAGYLSKSLIIGGTHNPIKRLFGVLMQWKVSNAVSEKSDVIQTVAGKLFHFFTKEKKKINTHSAY